MADWNGQFANAALMSGLSFYNHCYYRVHEVLHHADNHQVIHRIMYVIRIGKDVLKNAQDAQ